MLKLCKNTMHENIIALLDNGSFSDRGTTFYFIDMELCEMNLDEYNKCARIVEKVHKEPLALRETRIWDIMKQIANGLRFIHENNLIHRDLKPQNGTPLRQTEVANNDQFCT